VLVAAAIAIGVAPAEQVALREEELVTLVGEGVKLIETSKDGEKFESKGDLPISDDFDFEGPIVDIDATQVDQKITGFGGAFTEAAAVIFKKLSPDQQEELLNLYFGKDGIGYTVGRVHINSCDFSEKNYNFADEENDWDLVHFDDEVKHDTKALIPLIQRASQKAVGAGNDLRLLASPWSPPAWMKTNGQMDTTDLPNGLKPECSAVWAKYISRWITAYKNHEINIRWMTAQNEPMNAPGWEACGFSPEDQANFVGQHLGPTLKQDHPEVGIFVFDDSKHNMYAYAEAALKNDEAKQYVHGVAFHWYTGDLFENVAAVHKDFPEAVLLPSEATYERRLWQEGKEQAYSEWRFGEGYAHDIIGDLNAGAVGWIDWNLLLDKNGGPNHVGNVCDAAMVASEDEKSVEVHPQYYYIGHFSKYLLVGSQHLGTKVKGSTQFGGGPRDYGTCTGEDGLQATSFKRPDGLIAVVVLNCGDDEIEFKIREGESAIRTRIPAHAIQTYLIPHTSPSLMTQAASHIQASSHAVTGGSNNVAASVKAFRPQKTSGFCCFASEEDTCDSCEENAIANPDSICAKSRNDCFQCSSGAATWCPFDDGAAVGEVLKKYAGGHPFIAPPAVAWQVVVAAAGVAAAVAVAILLAVVFTRRTMVGRTEHSVVPDDS
jgi:glucosylceramidase